MLSMRVSVMTISRWRLTIRVGSLGLARSPCRQAGGKAQRGFSSPRFAALKESVSEIKEGQKIEQSPTR